LAYFVPKKLLTPCTLLIHGTNCPARYGQCKVQLVHGMNSSHTNIMVRLYTINMITITTFTIFRSGTDLISFLILFLLLLPLLLFLLLLGNLFKSDLHKICQDCSSCKYASIDWVGFLVWHHTFKMAAMMSFHAKYCHLVSEHEASATRLCSSVCQFLIYITFTLVLCICTNLLRVNSRCKLD